MMCECENCERDGGSHHVACCVHVVHDAARCDCGLRDGSFAIPRHIVVREEPCECGCCFAEYTLLRAAVVDGRLRVLVMPPFLWRTH